MKIKKIKNLRIMKMYNLFLFFLLISLFSCNPSHKDSEKTVLKPGKNDMTELNTYLVQKEREIIQNYVERKQLKMTESPTGLWYQITEAGSGKFFRDNDRIVMNYDCELLDGTKCYSSETLGPKEIVLGKNDLESGLNEGLRLLKPGAKAIFILPPFLGFGLVGDGRKIPPRATIIYTVSIEQ